MMLYKHGICYSPVSVSPSVTHSQVQVLSKRLNSYLDPGCKVLWSLCLYVCLSICVSQKPHIRISQDFCTRYLKLPILGWVQRSLSTWVKICHCWIVLWP